MTGKMLFLSIVWLHCSWWRCSTPHCRAEGDCGQAQWVQEKRETPCKQHAWNGNVERQPSSKCHVSWCAVLCRGLTYTGLVFQCCTTEMEQPGCSQGSEMGQPLQQEARPQPPIQQKDRQYVHSSQFLKSKRQKNHKSQVVSELFYFIWREKMFISIHWNRNFFVSLVSDARTLKALNDLELSF